jgi:hypothetical protein
VLFLDVGLMQYACGLTQEVAAAGTCSVERRLINRAGGYDGIDFDADRGGIARVAISKKAG